MSLSGKEWEAVKANLFPRAAAWVAPQHSFPWHRDRTKRVTAARPHSSQALAVDVFGTLDGLGSRGSIVRAWTDHLGLRPIGEPRFVLEYPVPRDLLGEPRQTQIDVLVDATEGFLLIECKFTERDGGGCSQVNPVRRGKDKLVQCSGDYVRQVNPVNGIESPCALSGKGIRYWELVPGVLDINADADHRPCPFRGGWYQWMRNLVSCVAMMDQRRQPGAVAIVYADGPFPIVGRVGSPEWREFNRLARGKDAPIVTVSYQVLLDWALEAVSDPDRAILTLLRDWVAKKVELVASTT